MRLNSLFHVQADFLRMRLDNLKPFAQELIRTLAFGARILAPGSLPSERKQELRRFKRARVGVVFREQQRSVSLSDTGIDSEIPAVYDYCRCSASALGPQKISCPDARMQGWGEGAQGAVVGSSCVRM